MKILTTAAFSVVLLRKRLSPTKWLALLFLAIVVGIVQIQNGSSSGHSSSGSGPDMLLTELLKGSISLTVAFMRLDYCSPNAAAGSSLWNPRVLFYRFRRLGKEV